MLYQQISWIHHQIVLTRLVNKYYRTSRISGPSRADPRFFDPKTADNYSCTSGEWSLLWSCQERRNCVLLTDWERTSAKVQPDVASIGPLCFLAFLVVVTRVGTEADTKLIRSCALAVFSYCYCVHSSLAWGLAWLKVSVCRDLFCRVFLLMYFYSGIRNSRQGSKLP